MKYAGLQGKVYLMLSEVPWTRERRDKSRALVRLLTERGTKFPSSEKELEEFGKDFSSADRYWRLLTENHPELRGSDYSTKVVIEQKFEIGQLGMESGFHENVRKLAGIRS